jgi:hypothetical protein
MMSDSVKPLWPKPIPIIGGTGEYESGKTLFGLTICPGPQTRYYDFEQSGASYNELGHERINVMAEMQKKYPHGYKPMDLFLWWLADVRQQEAGKYRVIVADPITDLERGLTDWVQANPGAFGHTAGQYAKMSGIMWGDVKDYQKSILADLSSRVETFYFTAHLGKEFEGNTATGKLRMKGKATLSELASLFLWFNRQPDKSGVKPNKPGAWVKKSRLLVVKSITDDDIEMVQVLPPKMAVCTPKTIREAFANPAGGREIDELERDKEAELTDDDRLKLQAEIARAENARSGGNDSAATTTPTDTTEADILHQIEKATTADDIKAIGAKLTPAEKTPRVMEAAKSRMAILKK